MDDLKSEDAAKIATVRRQMPHVCVGDAKEPIRAFLAQTLEAFGLVTSECADVAELAEVLASRLPDLIVIGVSAGGMEACTMLELLLAKAFKGKVLVLGPRASPMVAAVQQLGEQLGLAMLPLLTTPFSHQDVRDCIAGLAPVRLPPNHPMGGAASLRADLLELWYQPKIDIRTLVLSGAEALTHMRHPTLRMPSGNFGQDGDEIGAASQLVIERAIHDWRYFATRCGHIELAINLPIAFFEDPETVKNLCRQIPDHPAFEGLIIEINAIDAIRELKLVKDIAKLFRHRAIAISIDNLGAEWPSLSGLDEFPFVELKVARQFITGCAADRNKQATCRQIIDLADAMGARSVADGVESRADLRAVVEMGFHLAQGPLLATSMPAKTFASALAAHP